VALSPVSLAITPASLSFANAGVTEQASATLTMSDQSTVDATDSVLWASTSGTVFSITSTGLVTSLTDGNATLTATYEGISASAPVSVAIPVRVILPGFALIGGIDDLVDAVTPAVGLSVVGVVTEGLPIVLMWYAQGVAQFEIVSSGGYRTGMQSATGAAGYLYTPAFEQSGTFTLTMGGYDINGNPVLVSGNIVSCSIPVTIAPVGFGVGPFGSTPFGL